MSRRSIHTPLALAAAFAMLASGCSDNWRERAATGAAIGGGIAWLANGNPLLGGVIGAAGGVVTNTEQIDIDNFYW